MSNKKLLAALDQVAQGLTDLGIDYEWTDDSVQGFCKLDVWIKHPHGHGTASKFDILVNNDGQVEVSILNQAWLNKVYV